MALSAGSVECQICGKRKPAGDFYVSSGRRCKPCTIARNSEARRRKQTARRAARAAYEDWLGVVGLKLCPRCDRERPVSCFYVRPQLRRGRSSWCKDCQRLAVASHRRNREAEPSYRERIATRSAKRQRLDDLKAGPCEDCGVSLPPRCMHLHHRDPQTKRAGVAALVHHYSATIEEIEAEAAKCALLCANCHSLRHDGATRKEVVL